MRLRDKIFPKYPSVERIYERGFEKGGLVPAGESGLRDNEVAIQLTPAEIAPYRAIDDECREKLQVDFDRLDQQDAVLVEELMERETRLKEIRRSKAALKAAIDLLDVPKPAEGYAGAA